MRRRYGYDRSSPRILKKNRQAGRSEEREPGGADRDPARTGMKKRTLVLGVAAALALAGVVAVTRGVWWPQGPSRRRRRRAAADSGRGREGGQESVPVRVDLLGTVTPIASVAVKPRIDSEITEVHFGDGAMVRKATCCSRSTTARSRHRSSAWKPPQRRQGAARAGERDVERYTELVAKNATTLVTLNNAKTQVNIFAACSNPTPRSWRLCGCSSTTRSSARRSPVASAWPTSRSATSRPGRSGSARDHHPGRAGLRHLLAAAARSCRTAAGA